MFSDQKYLDFSKNQAALLLDKINNKLNNTFSKVYTNGNVITVYFRKEDIKNLHGLVIPEKIGDLVVEGKIIKERKIKSLK